MTFDEKNKLKFMGALEKAHALFQKLSEPTQEGQSLFDQLTSDVHPDEINATCDAVEEALKLIRG